MPKLLKNIAEKVPRVRLAKQKAYASIATYFIDSVSPNPKRKISKKVKKIANAAIAESKIKTILTKSTKDANNNKKNTAKRITEESEENVQDDLIKLDNLNDDSFEDLDALADQFRFSMLCTDDEDDDEGEQPAPPEWSLSPNRRTTVFNQHAMNQRTIETFFGSEYELVDMLEIFPKVNPRKAKRRKSSMTWNGPLRYSILPKY